MRKCKISAVKFTRQDDLIKEYGVNPDNFGPCPRANPGQEWILQGHGKPDGFCDEAWRAIHHYVFAIVHDGGGKLFFSDNWVRKPNIAIVSCNDGLRPVIFKVEAIDG